MKKWVLCVFCACCITGLLLTSVGAKELRIGVVDVENIINNSPDYKRIEGSLKKKSEELGKPLQQREQELGQQVQEFQKQAQAGIIKEDVRKQKESEFQKKFQEIQKRRTPSVEQYEILCQVMAATQKCQIVFSWLRLAHPIWFRRSA